VLTKFKHDHDYVKEKESKGNCLEGTSLIMPKRNQSICVDNSSTSTMLGPIKIVGECDKEDPRGQINVVYLSLTVFRIRRSTEKEATKGREFFLSQSTPPH